MSWAAYYVSLLPPRDLTPAISALLPLYPDESKSAAMIRHSMDVIQHSVQEVNPGQVPVITCDQPFYAIVKEIQWTWSASHGEDHFVIDMTGLKIIADWLEASGWTEAIVQTKLGISWTCTVVLEIIALLEPDVLTRKLSAVYMF